MLATVALEGKVCLARSGKGAQFPRITLENCIQDVVTQCNCLPLM